MNPNANGPQPQQMLPPQAVAAAVRRGSDPNSLFQQNPLASNVTPGAPTYDPSLAPQPPAGSQATNPMQQSAQMQGQMPGGQQPMSESEMILNALIDRLGSHSKMGEKTVSTLMKMIEAGIPTQPDQQANPPTA